MNERFENFTLAELKAVAKVLAVDHAADEKKSDLIQRLKDAGVTLELFKATLYPEDKPEVTEAIDSLPPAPVQTEKEPEEVLVKMTRHNFTYQIRGYTFKRDHPFALVDEETADYLIEKDGGFRTASPREAREFYGG